tara:strand:+ start:2175 stop:2408 length:234 start_codon:yes stop_codon:yes gene_type:complete
MFNCKVYHEIGETTSMTLMNKDFKNLKDIAEELGLTYQQVADMSSRNGNKNYQKFKYYPKISINRIPKKNITEIKDE